MPQGVPRQLTAALDATVGTPHDPRPRPDEALRRPAARQVRGPGRHQLSTPRRARSTACWAPTAPARPRPCGSSARCCGPPAARPRSTATTWSRSPSQVRRQIGFMSANTAVYDRMTAWEMVEYFGRLYGIADEPLRARMESLFDRLQDERHPRPAGREDVDRHEAEGLDRPGPRPRSAGADLRRGHRRAGRAGGPGAAEDGGRAARRTASASSSRRTSCARRRSSATGSPSCTAATSWPKARWTSCATGTSRTDLEELFFQLIRSTTGRSGSGIRQRADLAHRRPRADYRNELRSRIRPDLPHELVERQADPRPRDPRSVARPAHAVHDRRAADPALSAVGHEHVPDRAVHAGAADPGAGRGGARAARVCRRCSSTTGSPRTCSPTRPTVGLLELKFVRRVRPTANRRRRAMRWRRPEAALAKGDYDAVLYFPPDFGRRLDPFRERLRVRGQRGSDVAPGEPPIVVPSPEIIFNSGQRAIAGRPIARRPTCWRRWRDEIGRQNLGAAGCPRRPLRPFRLDAARRGRRDAPRRRPVVEDPAVPAVALGADRRVLSGRRPVRRRKGTRHAGDAAEQPRRAQRDRAGQAADDHALQHGHRRAEPGEHGHRPAGWC